MGNQLASEYELGRQVASGGPNYLWQVFEARKKKDGASVSLFVGSYASVLERVRGDQAAARRLWAQLQNEFTLLTRCKHPSLLAVSGAARELGSGSARMLVAETQPVCASLGNYLGMGLHSFSRTPDIVRSAQEKSALFAEAATTATVADASGRESASSTGEVEPWRAQMREGASALERTVEVKLGVLSVARALAFLHHKAHLVHLNVAPESVYVARDGTWLLAGLNYATFAKYHDQQQDAARDADADADDQSHTNTLFHEQEFTSSADTAQLQPPLDYAAPEYVLRRRFSHSADLFSLGVLLYRLHVGAPGLFHCRNNVLTYRATTAELSEERLQARAATLRDDLREAVCGLLSVEPAARLTIRAFLRSPYFGDASFRTLLYVATMLDKPDADKAAFLRGLVPQLASFEEATLSSHLLPHLVRELRTPSLLPHLVAPLAAVAQRLSPASPSLHEVLLPALLPLFESRKRVVVTPLLAALPTLLARLPQHPPLCTAALLLLERVLAPDKPFQLQDAGVRLGVRILPHLNATARARYLALLHGCCLPPYPLAVRRNAVVCVGKLLAGKHLDAALAVRHCLPTLESCLEECARSFGQPQQQQQQPAGPADADSSSTLPVATPAQLFDVTLRVYGEAAPQHQPPSRMATTSLPLLLPLLASPSLDSALFARTHLLCERMLHTVKQWREASDAAAAQAKQAAVAAADRESADRRKAARVTPSAIGHDELLARAFEQEADRLATDNERTAAARSRGALTPPGSPRSSAAPAVHSSSAGSAHTSSPGSAQSPSAGSAHTSSPGSAQSPSPGYARTSSPGSVQTSLLQPSSVPSVRRPATPLPAPHTVIDAPMKKTVPAPEATASLSALPAGAALSESFEPFSTPVAATAVTAPAFVPPFAQQQPPAFSQQQPPAFSQQSPAFSQQQPALVQQSPALSHQAAGSPFSAFDSFDSFGVSPSSTVAASSAGNSGDSSFDPFGTYLAASASTAAPTTRSTSGNLLDF